MDNLDSETTLPADWRPLLGRSMALAADMHTAVIAASITRNGSASFTLGPPSQVLVDAHATLLADLSRPASRDFWARWLAEKVGLTVGATAPEWRRFRMALPNGTESWAWVLLGKPGEQFFFTDGNAPGISTLTDPAAALRATLLAVEPA